MRDRKVATRYAGALLASAKEAGVLTGVAESYASLMEMHLGDTALRIFLASPQVRTEEKKELLQTVFAGRVEPLLLNFVYLLIDKNRMENFRDIGEAFAHLVEQEQGVMRARVTTAIALPADLEDQLRTRLGKLTGKTMILEKRVDPAVIGGVKVIMEDKILDGTVRANLDLLRKTLQKAPVR